MKLATSIAAALALLSVPSFATIVPHVKTVEPKTIFIGTNMGGISHIAWTLEIGTVLAERGHNVTFITNDSYTKFGKPYAPAIKTISTGKNPSKVQLSDVFDLDSSYTSETVAAFTKLMKEAYKQEFPTYLDIFKKSNPAIVICDQLASPCLDAARVLRIPMVAYTTMSTPQDTRAPFINDLWSGAPMSTKDLSFGHRLYDKYIRIPKFLYTFYPFYAELTRVRKELGIPNIDPMARHSGAIKMINGFWGMESPRPIGPFVEYVGPIISSKYDSLPEAMANFMDNNNKVVYIAFGQMYTPSPKEFEVLLKSLLEAHELGYYDAFIWSFSMKARQRPGLPTHITTSSGKTYNVQDLFDGKVSSSLRFETWSPQFAILNHANCKLFISHGGASSIHESLFNGVPLLLHPYVSDQPGNAVSMKDAGVGLVLNRKAHDVTDTVSKMKTILNDAEGTFKSNMESMQNLVHAKSKGKYHAADMIEEVLFSVRNKDDIWYRKEASADMRFGKATNSDIDLAFLVILASVGYMSAKLGRALRNFNPFWSVKRKIRI